MGRGDRASSLDLGHVERRRVLLDVLVLQDANLGEAFQSALADRNGQAVHDDRGHDDEVDDGLEDAAVSCDRGVYGDSLAEMLAVTVVGELLHGELGVEHGADAHGAKVSGEQLILEGFQRRDPWRLWSELSRW